MVSGHSQCERAAAVPLGTYIRKPLELICGGGVRFPPELVSSTAKSAAKSWGHFLRLKFTGVCLHRVWMCTYARHYLLIRACRVS